MLIKAIPSVFSVCKVPAAAELPLDAPYCFVGKTDCELSLVCPTARVPADVLSREDGWRAFRIEGTLDFSLIGILAKISAILADKKIGIFVVSTFDTDYVLTKAERFEEALAALQSAGYEIIK